MTREDLDKLKDEFIGEMNNCSYRGIAIIINEDNIPDGETPSEEYLWGRVEGMLLKVERETAKVEYNAALEKAIEIVGEATVSDIQIYHKDDWRLYMLAELKEAKR